MHVFIINMNNQLKLFTLTHNMYTRYIAIINNLNCKIMSNIILYEI